MGIIQNGGKFEMFLKKSSGVLFYIIGLLP